jgi:hypothetical protein
MARNRTFIIGYLAVTFGWTAAMYFFGDSSGEDILITLVVFAIPFIFGCTVILIKGQKLW